jgi:ribosomal protein L27
MHTASSAKKLHPHSAQRLPSEEEGGSRVTPGEQLVIREKGTRHDN